MDYEYVLKTLLFLNFMLFLTFYWLFDFCLFHILIFWNDINFLNGEAELKKKLVYTRCGTLLYTLWI